MPHAHSRAHRRSVRGVSASVFAAVTMVKAQMTSVSPTDPGTQSQLAGFERVLGLELLEVGEETARARLAVRDELLQPGGLVHGGVYASIAQSLATWATAQAVGSDGRSAGALSNQTSFLHPITDGTIDAVATRRHRGRTTWVWEVEFSDAQGRLCALTRMTVAIR